MSLISMIPLRSLIRDRRGVGAIIGAVFFLIILMTGYMYYTLHVNATYEYNQTLQEMQELDFQRSKESIEILGVSFYDGKLNITVKNSGSYLAHLIWVGVFDETVTPSSQDYYLLDFSVNPAETVTNIGSDTIPSFEGEERTIQLVTELGNTFSQSYPGSAEKESEYDFVDAEGDPPTIGNHGFFEGQKAGPDGICDILTEDDTGGIANTTLVDQESFEGDWPPSSPSPWSETGRWNKEANQAYNGTYSADFDGGGGRTGNLDTCTLNCSDATAIYVDFWYRDDGCEANEFRLYYYDGTSWDLIVDLGATTSEGQWLRYQEKMIDPQYFNSNFRVRWRATTSHWSDDMYVDLVTVTKEANSTNYRLDLEVQWRDVDYDEANEWLSIYGGTMTSEALRMDVWNGTAWINVFSDLKSGWNSIDVSPYLSSSTFKIRFRDSIQIGDTVQDSWEIDATFARVWTP